MRQTPFFKQHTVTFVSGNASKDSITEAGENVVSLYNCAEEEAISDIRS